MSGDRPKYHPSNILLTSFRGIALHGKPFWDIFIKFSFPPIFVGGGGVFTLNALEKTTLIATTPGKRNDETPFYFCNDIIFTAKLYRQIRQHFVLIRKKPYNVNQLINSFNPHSLRSPVSFTIRSSACELSRCA
jgi:hypothetical protein